MKNMEKTKLAVENILFILTLLNIPSKANTAVFKITTIITVLSKNFE